MRCGASWRRRPNSSRVEAQALERATQKIGCFPVAHFVAAGDFIATDRLPASDPFLGQRLRERSIDGARHKQPATLDVKIPISP